MSGNLPQMENLEAGKTYAWCPCGKTEKKVWCDGSHRGSNFTPKAFKVDEPKKAAICGCTKTKNAPYCDGSHLSL